MLSRSRRSTCTYALLSAFCFAAAAWPAAARAQAAQFDLQGPTLEVKVQRDGKTLPIAQVPNLRPGDRLWLHPVLGEHESVHYLMVPIFLRGSTNPPPDEWFSKVEAWNKQVMEEGIYLVVPPGAEQVVILFAPQTGGDFSTLRNAVRGRPGSFVRASQDLNLASLDRERINKYLHLVGTIQDPDKVKDESNTLARSLSLKLNQDCFTRTPDQQASCLQQSQSAMILDNGSSSTAQGLLNGPTSDLALQAGSTPGMAAGLYDPYIAAAFDIARILSSFHSAQYQYIPALSSDSGVDMNLWLNSPPSFHNPKSVLVVALPPIEEPRLPTLHPVDPKQIFCMQRTPLVLPVDGAPAIFATDYGHGLTLHLAGKSGKPVDLPTTPDAIEGGFVVPTPALANAGLGTEVQATVHGYWGFDPYTGPSFKLRSTEGTDWSVADADKTALVVGRDDELHLRSDAAACVEAVNFRDGSGKMQKATFKLDGADGIIATLPLKETQPGPITIAIQQYGRTDPKNIEVASFAEAGKYDAFTLHAGDSQGVLTGTRLDNVASLEVNGLKLVPGKLTRTGTTDALELASAASSAAGSASPTPPGPTANKDAGSDASPAAQPVASPSRKLVAGKASQPVSQPAGKDAGKAASRDASKDASKDAKPAAGKAADPQETTPKDAPLVGLAALSPGTHTIANATLKDGRIVPVPVIVDAARPIVALINKSVQLPPAAQPAPPIAMKLGGPDQLPLDGKLTFALKSQTPATFAKGESIEIATVDGLASVTFSLASGQLVLQDAKTVIASLDPSKSFGNSAFGALHLRPVMADGTAGDWLPLATLVRLPAFESYSCPADATQSCTLAGSSLFLLGAVAADPQFTKPVTVPDGFAGATLEVPHAVNGQLFVKLRDDPSIVNTVQVEAARTSAAARHLRRAAPPAATPVTPDAAAPAAGSETGGNASAAAVTHSPTGGGHAAVTR